MKKIFVTLSFLMVLCLVSVPQHTKADPALVTDCVGENADSEACKEESELKNPDEDEKQTDEIDVPVAENSAGTLIVSLIKTGLALVLILFLIYFLLKFLNKRNKLYNQVKTLENLGGISVGQNKSIQIVRVGSKVYMIGVGENVELLEEINDEEAITDLLNQQESNEFKGKNMFTSIFNSNTNKSNTTNEETDHNFKDMFSSELEKLKKNRLYIKKQQKEKDGKNG